jgi:hypothetical protein
VTSEKFESALFSHINYCCPSIKPTFRREVHILGPKSSSINFSNNWPKIYSHFILKRVMQFLTLFLLVTTSLASPLYTRDLATSHGLQDGPTVVNALDGIGAAIERCTSSITSWNGEVTGVEEILKTSTEILDAMNKAVTSISSMPVLGIMEAVTVIGPTNTLSAKVDAVTAALISKKAAFEKLGVLVAVTDTLKEQKRSADTLQKAIMDKMPALATPIAKPMAKQFGDKLDAALKQLGA